MSKSLSWKDLVDFISDTKNTRLMSNCAPGCTHFVTDDRKAITIGYTFGEHSEVEVKPRFTYIQKDNLNMRIKRDGSIILKDIYGIENVYSIFNFVPAVG